MGKQAKRAYLEAIIGYLVVDGHPIHKAKRVKEFVEAQAGKLKLFYLPPYSPHLNPDDAGVKVTGFLSGTVPVEQGKLIWLH